MNSFDVFCLYHAINLHFTSKSYDFFKYSGKVKITVKSFESRKDKFFFKKLSNKIPDRDGLIVFFTANILENGKNWIGNLLADESFDTYYRHKAVLESIEYRFEQDCRILFSDTDNPATVFQVSTEYPLVLKMLFRKEINIETLCILSRFIRFINIFNKEMADDIRWPSLHLKIIKYNQFIKIDNLKFKEILKQILQEAKM